MISNSKKIILRIIGFILVVILILIVVQYVSLMIKNNENNSSQTVDTIEENNKLIHTEIKENDKQKFLEDAQENLILQITDKLKNKLEGFEDPEVCAADLKHNIFYLYLHVELLETSTYKPEPIWTNTIFCIYKMKPILSLDTSISEDDASDDDFYYSLGDVILFKKFPEYLQSYNENLTKFLGERERKACIPTRQTSNNNNSNNKNTNNNNSNNNNSNNKNTNNKNSNNNNSNNKNTNNKNSNNKNQENFANHVPKPDSNITNYDQPGLGGLKIMIKNGAKPVGFEPEPVCIIKGNNGENVYFWRPIAREGHVFLGDVVSIGVTPNVPLIDSCNVRSIPLACVDNINLGERAVVVSEDIPKHYKIYLTAQEKYFKAFVDTGLKDNVPSYDLTTTCLNVERDTGDIQTKINIVMVNTDGAGGVPSVELVEGDFNLIIADIKSEITKKLVLYPDLKLNNVLNNSQIDAKVFNKRNMRFRLELEFIDKNQFTVSIIFRHRAIAYGEITTDKILEMIIDNFKEIMKFSFRANGKDYQLEANNIGIIPIGMNKAEKELLSELEIAIRNLKRQVELENDKKNLDSEVLDHFDILIHKSEKLNNAIINILIEKEVLINEVFFKCEEMLDMVSQYDVEELKAAIKKLKNIVETFREIATAAGAGTDEHRGTNEHRDNAGEPDDGSGGSGGSVRNCNMGNVNSDYNIDQKLRDELVALAGLATRKGNDIPIQDFFKYNHGLDNPMTISELK